MQQNLFYTLGKVI